MRLSQWNLLVPAVCAVSRNAQVTNYYGCLRLGKSSPHPPAAGVEAQETSRADVEMGLDELPRADLLRLLHGREQLVLAWAENVGWAPTDFVCPHGTQTPPENGGSSTSSSNDGHRLGCVSASPGRVSARWAELVHTSGLYVQQMVDPLIGLQVLMEIPWREEGFCRKCVAARMNTWKELRKKLWDNLDACVWLELTAAEDDKREVCGPGICMRYTLFFSLSISAW